jgi:hypothetical protein
MSLKKIIFLFIFFHFDNQVIPYKKSLSLSIKEAALVIYPSITILSIGLGIEKIITGILTKNNNQNKVRKTIEQIIKLIPIVPGIALLLRSGIPNVINVFNRTKKFESVYEEDIIKIDVSDNQQEVSSGKSCLFKQVQKTLCITVHGTQSHCFLRIPGVVFIEQDVIDAIAGSIKIDLATKHNLDDSQYIFKSIVKKNENIFYDKVDQNIFHFRWNGRLSNAVRKKASEKLSQYIEKQIQNEQYNKIVLLSHSYGGEVSLNAIKKLYHDDNIKKIPIEFGFYMSPFSSSMTDSLDTILQYNSENKALFVYAPSDFIAQYDPSHGQGILSLGERVNDQFFEERYGKIYNKSNQVKYCMTKNFNETGHNSNITNVFNGKKSRQAIYNYLQIDRYIKNNDNQHFIVDDTGH